MGEISASAAFAGKMKDAVWKSPLVQWLVTRGELDLLPWREIMMFRVLRQQRSDSSQGILVTSPERDSTSRVTKIFLPTKKGGEEFNLHTWKSKMMSFRIHQRHQQSVWERKWDKLVADAKILEGGGSVVFPPEDDEDEEWEQTEFTKHEMWALDIDRWLRSEALGVLSPEDSAKASVIDLSYEYIKIEDLPGVFLGDWMIYPLQLANVFTVLFYYQSD
jgi:hypothetical protein